MSYNSDRVAMCGNYSKCSAPLCPVFDMKGIWYANEEICKMQSTNVNMTKEGIKIIRWQKRIRKVNKTKPVIGYFTAKDLLKRRKVIPGVQGHNPTRN